MTLPMPMFLSPQNDAVFKLLFGKSENSELLIDFLTAVLAPPVPIDSVTIQNPEIPKTAAADKTIVLDVVAKLSDGKCIDIEMQVAQRASFRSRVLFYLCRMHQSQMDVADEYSIIKPSVSIAILDYKETDEDKFHTVYELKERETHTRFSQDLSVHLIELPKLKRFFEKTQRTKAICWPCGAVSFWPNQNLKFRSSPCKIQSFKKPKQHSISLWAIQKLRC